MIEFMVYCAKLRKTEAVIVSTVTSSLYLCCKTQPDAFDLAANEIRAALIVGSKNHVPKSSGIWEIIMYAVRERPEIELDSECDYMLTALYSAIVVIIADELQSDFLCKILKLKMI